MNDETLDALAKSAGWALTWLDVNGVEAPLEMEIKAAELIKTIPFFLRAMRRLVQTLYDGYISGEFIETAKNLISGQIRKAYQEVWKQDGTDESFPAYLEQAAAVKIAEQQSFVDGYYRDIVDAKINATSIEPLLMRVDLWVNRYNESKDEAAHLIALENGGKEIWIEGDTVDKCPTCLALDGIVAYAREWEAAGFRPQNAPNKMLDCEGWHCGCRREPTTKRRSPRALETLMNIAIGRQME